LEYDTVAQVGLQVAQALTYAHARGVLHRDIKPSNLLLDESGVVWVTDFGLAKGEGDYLTHTGDFLGTLRYMAPERFLGACDARADVYGLGLTLYELLTLRPAFADTDQARLLNQVRFKEPPRPRALNPGVPRDLETVVLKAMDKEPARRYQTAAELADDLQRFLDRRPTRARPLGPVERVRRWASRHPAVAALLAAVGAVLLLGIACSSYFALEASRRAGEAVLARDKAQTAEARAVRSEEAAQTQSAGLLLDQGLRLAREGKVNEAVHWMLASLRVSPDPDFQRGVRTHLATWGARLPALRCWLDTPHRAVALSPDGTWLVTAGSPGSEGKNRLVTLQFWDARDGRPDGPPLRSDDTGVQGLSFSPDGRTLLAVSGGAQEYQGHPGWASRWDVAGRQFLGKSTGHTNVVSAAFWSPDGGRYLTLSADGTPRLWDGTTGKAIGQPIPVPKGTSGVAWCPDGQTLLIVSGEGAYFWDLTTGQRLPSPLPPFPPAVRSVAVSPDGQRLLVGTRPGERPSVTVLPRQPGPQAAAQAAPLVPYPTEQPAFLADGRVVACAAAAVTPAGTRFACYRDGVQVWDIPRDRSRQAGDLSDLPAPARPPEPAFHTALFSPDGGRCWTVGGGRRAQAWDVATGRPVGVPLPAVPIFGLPRLALTRDGRLAATIPPGGVAARDSARFWDVATGSPVGPPLPPQWNTVLALEFSPDGKILATGGHLHEVYLWDTITGRLLGRPLVQGNMSLDLTFSPDGQTLAVATFGGEARLWNVPLRKLLVPPLVHPDAVWYLAFSPDGTRLLTQTKDAGYLWDARTGRPIGTPMVYPQPADKDREREIRGLFSPDSKVVLVSAGFGSFRLHDAATTLPLGPPTPAGEAQRNCFAFSPDSRLVVAGRPDGTAQLWDVSTSRPLGAPVVTAGPVFGVGFAADSGSCITVGGNGTFRHWPVPAPLEGDVERLARSLRLTTGLEMDANQTVVPLTRAAWQEERRRWLEREGEQDWGVAPTLDERVWHEARARDAEESGASFTARWHLDRLIGLAPDDWLLYARRARTHTDEEHWDLAEADYRRARELGAGAGLLEWFRFRAWFCQHRGRAAAAQWYQERIAREPPGG
jgi:WD40 repeat protein